MHRHWMLALALSSFACKPAAEKSEAAPSSPPLRSGDVARSIFRAQYEIESGNVQAGTIFLARLEREGPVLAITAHHIFGTLGGLRQEVAPDDLVRTWEKGSLKDIASGKVISPLPKPLLIGDAKRFTTDVLSTDVAAFPIADAGSMVALPAAASRPKVGDTVWLIASIVGQEKSGELQHPARVVMSDDDALVFEYQDPKLELRATSGAPVLSSKGEIVGINLSGGKKEAKLMGMAGAIPNVKKRIASALPH
jgi:hypothetical protein